MAQEAHKRASKVMDAATEARLAKIINSDLEQLREKAEGKLAFGLGAARPYFSVAHNLGVPAVQGVLAYGLKPVRRERLNERFLQNTLKSVGFGECSIGCICFFPGCKTFDAGMCQQSSMQVHVADAMLC